MEFVFDVAANTLLLGISGGLSSYLDFIQLVSIEQDKGPSVRLPVGRLWVDQDRKHSELPPSLFVTRPAASAVPRTGLDAEAPGEPAAAVPGFSRGDRCGS